MESYRGWRLKGGKLWSYAHQFEWESSTLVASCAHGCDAGECLEKHPICACGIYSKNSLVELIKEYPAMDIYGIVYNHGVVIEGEKGVRAEKVTIRALFTADFAQGAILARNYPGVAIVVPPPEILALSQRAEREDDWQGRMMRARARNQERIDWMKDAQKRYPGGFAEEKKRLESFLRNKTRKELVQFAKLYVATSDEWAKRVWGGKIEKRTKKAKPGDMVFEANNTVHPYVFIGSCRPNQYASMRYLLDRNGVLVRRPNIRRWDEEPGLMEARQQAIEEWE